jgi:hypothetical protein
MNYKEMDSDKRIMTPEFNQLPTFWKILIIIGSIAIFIIFCLIIAVLYLTKQGHKYEHIAAPNNDHTKDFLDEFMNGKESSDPVSYPVLPKIKDFDGNYLRDLMEIKII